jgi:hypothetical protein
MLALKPACEHCGKLLPNESEDAMICTFECTFCKDCVDNILYNICPNCGGNFEKRPIRPKQALEKYPASKDVYIKPIDFEKFDVLKNKYIATKPKER